MNIVLGLCHGGYDAEFAKLDHTFYVARNAWHPDDPVPPNVKLYKDRLEPMDLAVGGIGPDIPIFKDADIPIIVNMINGGDGFYQKGVDKFAKRVCFLCEETAERWPLRDETKKRVMGYGFHPDQHPEYIGDEAAVLASGNNMTLRSQPRDGYPPDKDVGILNRLNEIAPVHLYGLDNADHPSIDKGILTRPLPWHEKARHYKVYVNPSKIINMVALEMMAIGIPMVTLEPINWKRVVVDEETALIAKDEKDLQEKVQALLKDEARCKEISRKARAMIYKTFDYDTWIKRWDDLFQEVLNNG